jgi:hypothetical protein
MADRLGVDLVVSPEISNWLVLDGVLLSIPLLSTHCEGDERPESTPMPHCNGHPGTPSTSLPRRPAMGGAADGCGLDFGANVGVDVGMA